MIEIYESAGLTSEEIEQMHLFIEEGPESDFIFTDSFEKLFNYFFDTEEMPYSTASGRDGEPDVWILDHLHNLSVS